MSDLDLQSTFQAMNINVSDALQAVLLSAGLGVLVSILYRVANLERVISPTFQRSLVVLCMVGTLVMMVIGNNLARAFSLVGALSIVRFRTELQTAWDISFVFFALAVGIGCGVFAWHVVTVGTVVISLVILALQAIPLSGWYGDVHLLRCDLAAYQGTEADVAKVLDKHLPKRSLEQVISTRFGEAISYHYRVAVKRNQNLEPLIKELSALEGVERVIITTGEDEGDPDQVR